MNSRVPVCAFFFVSAAIIAGMPYAASAQLVQFEREVAELPHAALACKLRMGRFTESEIYSPNGTKCAATCEVISWLKGDAGKEVEIIFRRGGNGRIITDFDAVKEGQAYVVLMEGAAPPYRVFAAMKAVDEFVKPTLGTKPGDRLMAELLAMCKSDDVEVSIAALRQIGVMRDKRGSKVAAEAAKDGDPETARAGVIALYQMKIAPDAKRVMEVFDERVLNVWYQESGQPQKDAKGQDIWRMDGNRRILERGLPDFDYATFVREGIKHDWILEDEHAPYLFFGVPWKVQRKHCVPELVKLLEHSDKRVQWWAVTCLAHTVEDQHEQPAGVPYKEPAPQEVEKWRKWWKEQGKAYMAR